MSANAVMPEELSIGFISRPTFSTDKLPMVNGQEVRTPNRTMVIHEYKLDLINAPYEMIEALRGFWMSRRGDFHAFLMKDWADFELSNEIIGIGNGATTQFQVTKIYGTDDPYLRILRHLIPGFAITGNGITVPPANYTQANGMVTFSSPPGAGVVIAINGGFYVPVRFEGDEFAVSVPLGDRRLMTVQGVAAIEVVP